MKGRSWNHKRGSDVWTTEDLFYSTGPVTCCIKRRFWWNGNIIYNASIKMDVLASTWSADKAYSTLYSAKAEVERMLDLL